MAVIFGSGLGEKKYFVPVLPGPLCPSLIVSNIPITQVLAQVGHDDLIINCVAGSFLRGSDRWQRKSLTL
jgi:hypothetical protein